MCSVLLPQYRPTEAVARSADRLGALVVRSWVAALRSSCRVGSDLVEVGQGSACLASIQCTIGLSV